MAEMLLDESYVQKPLARLQENTGPKEVGERDTRYNRCVPGPSVWDSESLGVLGQVLGCKRKILL